MTRKEAPPDPLTPLSELHRRQRGDWKPVVGKPLETMGRKARGCRAFRPMLVRLHGGKPRETVGRKARGCRALCPMLVRLHGKPEETPGRKTRGYGATELSKRSYARSVTGPSLRPSIMQRKEELINEKNKK